MTGVNNALRAALLFSITCGAGQARDIRDPLFVQPETLDQGFVIVVEDRSGVASSQSPIYLASNHNGWHAGDPDWKLSQRSDGRWQIVLPKPALDSRMAFKFTRGSWETVETDADYGDIENRLLPRVDVSGLAPGERPVIELAIESFRDQRPWEPAAVALDRYRPIEVVGTLRRLPVVGGGGRSVMRDVLVWLPPCYDDPANAQRAYPVLYLQDGQNVFEHLPGAAGGWEADETATRLIEAELIEPIIIAAVPHAGPHRTAEYLPFPAFPGVEARGDQYVAFLVGEVVPRVERSFRARADREGRAIGGASLGAAIALHAATLHPDLFGGVLAESPPLLLADGALERHFQAVEQWPERIYAGIGGREAGADEGDAELNRAYVDAAGRFESLLAGAGVGEDRRLFIIDPDATHDETAWAARLPDALQFLFPPR